MSIPAAAPDRGSTPHGVPVGRLLAGAVAATAVLAGAVLAASAFHPDREVFAVALAVHFAALVAGFGAVLAVDWFGLLWLRGRRGLGQVVDVAAGAQPLIWLGLAGLVVSGAFLKPDLHLAITRIQLVLVLAVALNGVFATRPKDRLAAAASGTGSPPRPGWRLIGAVAASTAVSQLGWWGSLAIGVYISHH